MKKKISLAICVIFVAVAAFAAAGCNGNSVKVSFNTGTGQRLPSKRCTYFVQYGELPTPEREYFEFAGWFISDTYEKQVTESTLVMLKENHTLYAKWDYVGLESYPSTLAVGGDYSLAIDKDGGLWAWGRNIYGTLGDGTFNDSYTPVPIMEGTEFTQVAASTATSYAIDVEGNLWGWGDSAYAMTGFGNVPQKIIPGTKFKQVSAGGYICMAIDVDGYLWAGGNFNDVSPDGDNIARPFGKFSKTLKFKHAAVASEYVLMVDIYGRIWGWGHNDCGQLGNGQIETNRLNFDYPPTLVKSEVKFKQVSANFKSSFGLDENGNIWSWGKNKFGQLGYKSVEEISPIPHRIASGVKFIRVASAAFTGFAIDTDENLWIWGRNSHGVFGTYNYNILLETVDCPTRFFGDMKFKEIAVDFHLLAKDSDGNFWTWGSNQRGQCGTGVVSEISEYTKIELKK